MIKREFNCYDLGDVADLNNSTPEEFARKFNPSTHASPRNPNKGLLKVPEEEKLQPEPQK